MTEEGTNAAIEQVETELKDDKVLVIFLLDCRLSPWRALWPAGSVNGTISLYLSPYGRKAHAKGSGRSIEAYPHASCPLVEVERPAVKVWRSSYGLADFSLERGECRRISAGA